MKDVEKKRQKEQQMVEEMICLYCPEKSPCLYIREALSGMSGTSGLCQSQKRALSLYERENLLCELQGTLLQIGNERTGSGLVMRFSGPRMLLYHPILAIWHLVSSKREKRRTDK